MAYNDWGAGVRRDYVRRPDREDVAAFNPAEAGFPSAYRIFANLDRLMKAYLPERAPWHEHLFHAVLGDGDVRLLALRARPVLCERRGDDVVQVDLEPFRTAIGGHDDGGAFAGTYAGRRFEAWQDTPGRLALELVEPDGTLWTAVAGYRYGAGHERGESADWES